MVPFKRSYTYGKLAEYKTLPGLKAGVCRLSHQLAQIERERQRKVLNSCLQSNVKKKKKDSNC